MQKTEAECVGCGLPCKGNLCPYSDVTRWYCDECGDEVDPEKLYIHPLTDKQYCRSCMLLNLDTVEKYI